MTRGTQGTDHVWLVMMKAMRALTRYAPLILKILDSALGLRRAGTPAAQRAFARQYDRPNRRSDPRLDQHRCGSPRREGLGQPGRERRRPTRSDRCPHATRQGSHCFSVSNAFREMKGVFSELSPEELRGLEVMLKKVGKRAAALMELRRCYEGFRPLLCANLDHRSQASPDSCQCDQPRNH